MSVNSDISRAFAEYALRQSDFPMAAIEAAKTFIQDSIGVGIAGSKAPFRDAAFKATQSWGEGGACHIFGEAGTYPAPTAAFMNGYQIHGMEYDCVHEPAVVHPMAVIFGALSAEAQKRKTTGRELIEAVIVAVDVAVELGVAVTSPLKFFRPATAGLFGATLGISRLRGYDAATAMSAMGCALAQCSGVMQAHVEGKPTLPLQIANAARAAIIANDFAKAGLHGPDASLEGPFGYFAMFEEEADAKLAAERLGKVHRITEVSWKPFPTGRAAQGGIVCVQKLLEQGVAVDQIASLILSGPPIIPRLVARPMIENMSANYARLCFPYLGAITLLRGTVGLSDFSEEDLSDTEIRVLADKISVTTNHVTDPAEFIPQSVTAKLKSGETVTSNIDKLFGSPADPLSHEQHIEKFRSCLSFGLRKVNAQKRADGLIGLTKDLEREVDLSRLWALTIDA